MGNAVLDINGIEVVVSTATSEIYKHFSKKTDTVFVPDFADILFVKIFQITYLKDIGDYYCKDNITRSNWTHHTANTFLRTCQILNYVCDFEIENRHDAAMRDNEGNVYLCAEWEYEANSVFKEKGELKKLYETCKKHSNCVAVLFTYKIHEGYIEFTERVYDEWNSFLKPDEDFTIHLITAIFEKDEVERGRTLTGLRNTIINNACIEVWDDYTY